ncbi:MAG: hypothetical protein JSV66_11420 [Trueperaceae bacterium]|nr:MAG: hypothetical protein JSV66_11420 [Trueperaceae bacterium]
MSGSTTLSWVFTDPDSDSFSCTIDIGDGSEPVVIEDCSRDSTLVHAFGATGIYTPTLTVSDGAISAVASAEVTVVSWTERAKVAAADAGTNDRFGFSVSIDGDTAVVGAYLDDDAGLFSGSAYVFVRDGTTWIQQAKLTAADAAVGDQFGYAVALSGDTVLVGSRLDDGALSNSGSAYIFVRNGEMWTQQAKLTASDENIDSEFGNAVSLSGDIAVVGAYLDDQHCPAVPDCDSGSAYVFERTGVSWQQQVKLIPSDSGAGDRFGTSVVVSGETVVVGARLDDDAGSNSGSAYVFVREAGIWSQQAKLTAADAAAGSEFGYAVGLDGDTVVIGSRLDDRRGSHAGSAYVFVRSGTHWSQQAKLTAADAAVGDEFGAAVAIDEDRVVIGAPLDDDGGLNAGAAYLFVRSGDSWSELVKLTAGDASGGERFGTTVATSGSSVLIGAHLDDDGGSNTGSIYLFENLP